LEFQLAATLGHQLAPAIGRCGGRDGLKLAASALRDNLACPIGVLAGLGHLEFIHAKLDVGDADGLGSGDSAHGGAQGGQQDASVVGVDCEACAANVLAAALGAKLAEPTQGSGRVSQGLKFAALAVATAGDEKGFKIAFFQGLANSIRRARGLLQGHKKAAIAG
jgi:hypothetical protein